MQAKTIQVTTANGTKVTVSNTFGRSWVVNASANGVTFAVVVKGGKIVSPEPVTAAGNRIIELALSADDFAAVAAMIAELDALYAANIAAAVAYDDFSAKVLNKMEGN